MALVFYTPQVGILFRTKALNMHEKLAKTAFIRPVGQEVPKRKAVILTKTIHVEGLDQTGIVFKVSKFLADNGINIITLNTETRLSPQSGATMYVMTIVVEIPTQLSLQSVEDGLSQIGDNLNVDVSLE